MMSGNWLPGRKGIIEVLRHNPRCLRRILMREGLKLEAAIERELYSLAQQASIAIVPCAREEFDEILPDTQAQGLLAEVQQEPWDEKRLIEHVCSSQGLLVICDQISDPQNLGNLFRVAEAAGASGLLITRDRSASITPAVRKAAVGATELLPWAKCKNLQRSLEQLRASGVWILGADIGPGTTPLYQAPRLRPAAIVLGAEGEGMRRLTKERCDMLIEIPMRAKIQSLNVSQAAAVLLYELTSPERVLAR